MRVVGVLGGKGFNFFGQDQDDVLLVPYTTAMKRVTRRDRINSILIQSQSPELMERIQADITSLLQQRRQGREPDFTVRNQLELAEAANANNRIMTILLGCIAGISLLVGAIGIMNIMLVSVTERTREIGIRLAVGAHGKDVLLQFLTEAVVLSLVGGTLGILLGVGSSQLVSHFLKWPTLLSVFWMLIAVGGSAFVGIISGFYPALKASQLDPIDALRYE
jgi:putative ABC transport system permease protein